MEWYRSLEFIGMKILLPAGIGVLAFIISDRWTEWKNRRAYSELGVAILQSIKVEIVEGMNRLHKSIDAALAKKYEEFLEGDLPDKIWLGPETINDQILLRIVICSKKTTYGDDFHPKDIRTHLNRYFNYIIGNVREIKMSVKRKYNSFPDVLPLAVHDLFVYWGAIEKVIKLIEDTQELLRENSRKIFPR